MKQNINCKTDKYLPNLSSKRKETDLQEPTCQNGCKKHKNYPTRTKHFTFPIFMNPDCVKNENLTNMKEAQMINAHKNAVNKLHLSNQKKLNNTRSMQSGNKEILSRAPKNTRNRSIINRA